MKMRSHCSRRYGRPGGDCRCDFAIRPAHNPTLVELIKDVVPPDARSWNKTTK
jgi:hypothetical protein